MTAEEWRDVAEFPGYKVSNSGRLMSFRWKTPRVLTPQADGRGYLVFLFSTGGRRTARRLHCLVAEAFLGPRPEGMEVRHLDGDGQNNALENLTYGTHSENMYDRVQHGRDPMASKTACSNGHPFDAENTRVDSLGHRKCRACGRARVRAHRERQMLRAATTSNAA